MQYTDIGSPGNILQLEVSFQLSAFMVAAIG